MAVLAIMLEALVTSWDAIKCYISHFDFGEHATEIMDFIEEIDEVFMRIDEFREKIEGWANGG